MKIKKVAVVFQNNIQFESFKEAVYIMQKRDIQVDIYIPNNNGNDGFGDMFNAFYNSLIQENFNIYREPNDTYYDILFQTYQVFNPDTIKRKYTIKYMYGYITKPEYSLSLKINYPFDAFLCYGYNDSLCLSNFGKTFQIGNIKYLNTLKTKRTKREKKVILYLPTYGDYSSIDIVGPELVKFLKDYDIFVKLHHGTEFLKNNVENKRRKFIKENFKYVFASKDSLYELINECDIVLTDPSGAIFDAICLDKPVIVYYKNSQNSWGEYKPYLNKLADHKNILSIKETINYNILNSQIRKALTQEQMKLQNEAKTKLICCDNKDTGKKFIEFLNAIENNAIDEDFYFIHKHAKNAISEQIKLLHETKIKLEKSQNKNSELENIIKNYKNEINNLNKWIKNINYEYEKVIHSFSWKITRPLRAFRKILKNKK